MGSVAQVQANRFNAQKSIGPRTPEGEAKVAQNAVTHGLLARAAVLQGEDWEEYTCYHERMLEELDPDGRQELEVAERIESSLCRARADLRQLRRQAPAVAPGGETPFDQRWEESGGHSHASPVARADLARENPECETKPIGAGSGLVPWEESLCQAPLRADKVGRGRPTYEETPGGVTTNARAAPSCETKPIGAGSGLVPREEPTRQGPPRVDKVGRGHPTLDQVEGRLYEETPHGGSARASANLSCETKPKGSSR